MNIEKIIELKDKLLDRIEESLKMIDNIDYCEDDFLDYGGVVYDKVDRLRDNLADDICEIVSSTNKYDLAIAIYLREESYWWVNDMIKYAESEGIPYLLCKAYDLYKECFTKDKVRFENIEDVRENIFELYKTSRRCDAYKSQEYASLLANVCEFINAE